MTTAPVRETRSSVILHAAIDRGAETTECRVRNLSATGACVDNLMRLTKGETIHVIMGTLPRLTAQVMWANDRLAGLHFDRTIDLAAARQHRARTDQAPSPTGARFTTPPAAPTRVPPPTTAPTPSAGWINNIRDPYRR